jgi:hypothetical protein
VIGLLLILSVLAPNLRGAARARFQRARAAGRKEVVPSPRP